MGGFVHLANCPWAFNNAGRRRALATVLMFWTGQSKVRSSRELSAVELPHVIGNKLWHSVQQGRLWVLEASWIIRQFRSALIQNVPTVTIGSGYSAVVQVSSRSSFIVD